MPTTTTTAKRRRLRQRIDRPEIAYRFPVRDPATGSTYFVVIQDDGLAFREDAVAADALLIAV